MFCLKPGCAIFCHAFVGGGGFVATVREIVLPVEEEEEGDGRG
jgi:hypothetical protein